MRDEAMTPKADRTCHVAIIMDGNGRWATRRGLPRLEGHRQGARTVRDVVRSAPDMGITHLTLFAFSTENWKRPEDEVSGLMTLFRRYLRKESAELERENVCVRFIGERTRLGEDLQQMMVQLEDRTRNNTLLNLTVAINYGGRDEITRATRRIAARIADGTIAPEDVSEDVLCRNMDTCHLPDPDLVIRTSGELRISNFLLWQAAYAEYAFVDETWPEFTSDLLRDQVDRLYARERRFGAVMA